MRLIILSLLLISLDLVQPHCNLFIDSLSMKCKYGLKESPTGIGAGFIRNLTTQCLYDKPSDESQYKFTWRHPEPTGAPVSEYRIKITYQISKHVCFLVPSSQTTFVFNQSMGLLYGCGFDLYVTPLPIAYVNNAFEAESIQVYGCPVAPLLLPLPNVVARSGSSYSYFAKFNQEPIPSPLITWYFTVDKIYCKNLTLVKNGKSDVFLSEDRRALTILNISKQHIGCYVAVANNSIGHKDIQRGYLDLNISSDSSDSLSQMPRRSVFYAFEGPLIGSLAGIMVALFIVLLILKLRRKRRSVFQNAANPEETLLKGSIYISHCAVSEKEQSSLIQFAADLKGSGFDVILDLFNQVEINHAGGMCRWVQKNIVLADKIIVLFNQNYLAESKWESTRNSKDDANENIRKVKWELNYINNIAGSTPSKCKENIVILSDIGNEDLPCFLRGARKFKMDVLNKKQFKSLLEILQS